MIVRRKPRAARTADETLRDRQARGSGLTCLAIAGAVALLHDTLPRVPPGRFAHDCEQIALGAMLVVGMLGWLLIFEGRRLFGGSRRPDRFYPVCREPAARRKRATRHGRPARDGAAFDTRAGVASLLARRALDDAARASRAAATAPDRLDLPRS